MPEQWDLLLRLMMTSPAASAHQHRTVEHLTGVSVLVVEDHEDLRELLAMGLRNEGASVTETDGVDTALCALRSREFSLLVSDIAMPGRDGYDLIRWVRSVDAPRATRSIPAVAVTALASAADRAKALAAGFTEHVAKPIDMPMLIEILARLAAPSG
jgi:CheY-like chemotaxis protein